MNLLKLINYLNFNSRLKENISYQFIGLIVKIFAQLFFPVLMIITWGAEIYGIWIIILAIVSTVYGFNFNFSEVLRLEMTRAYEQKHEVLLDKLYTNNFVAHSYNILIFTILIILSSIFFLDFSNFQNENLTKVSLYYCYFFVVVAYYIEFLTYYFYPTINFRGFTKIWVNQNSIYQIYSKIFILIAFFFKDFLFIGLFFMLSNLVRLILIYFFNKKEVKNYKFNKRNIDFSLIRNLFVKSFSFSLEKINYLVRQNGLILIIANFFSPTIVTMLNTARTLFYYLPINFFDILIHSSVIEFSKLSLKNISKDIQQLLSKFFLLMILLSIAFLFFANLFGKNIYEIWIQTQEINITYLIILLISFDAVIISILNLLIAPFKSFNNFFFLSKIDFFFTASSLLMSLFIGYYLENLNAILLLILLFHISLLIFIKYNLKNYLDRLC